MRKSTGELFVVAGVFLCFLEQLENFDRNMMRGSKQRRTQIYGILSFQRVCCVCWWVCLLQMGNYTSGLHEDSGISGWGRDDHTLAPYRVVNKRWHKWPRARLVNMEVLCVCLSLAGTGNGWQEQNFLYACISYTVCIGLKAFQVMVMGIVLHKWHKYNCHWIEMMWKLWQRSWSRLPHSLRSSVSHTHPCLLEVIILSIPWKMWGKNGNEIEWNPSAEDFFDSCGLAGNASSLFGWVIFQMLYCLYY